MPAVRTERSNGLTALPWTVSRYGIDVRVGIGPTVTVATTASAQVPRPGGVLAIEAADAAGWLALA
ncbi:hypothetical protein [Streptomyces sp. NPDC088847]|uniref:hypothetical protein n=1 Tax=Streptomyces sp. NPDC088847 TaxID=3365909 RepID=UPI0038281D7D